MRSLPYGAEAWAAMLARDPIEMEGDEPPAMADVEGLRKFIEGNVLPWFKNRKKDRGGAVKGYSVELGYGFIKDDETADEVFVLQPCPVAVTSKTAWLLGFACSHTTQPHGTKREDNAATWGVYGTLFLLGSGAKSGMS
jgi:hypothetical protein